MACKNKTLNAIIWNCKGISLVFLPFRGSFFLLSCQRTNGAKGSKLQWGKVEVNSPLQTGFQFSFGKIKGLNSLRDGQGKMWLTFFLLKSSHFAFELQGSSLVQLITAWLCIKLVKKKNAPSRNSSFPTLSCKRILYNCKLLHMLYCFRIMNECV